jgi:hypothetical protein
MIPQIFAQTNGFITRWTVSGDATARTITLPLVNTRSEGSLSYNCTVDWGDGSALSTVTAYNDANRTHTYASNGTYNVEVRGTCEGWSFNNAGDKLKIVAVVYWGDAGGFNGFKYLANGFWGCTNLTSLGTGVILPSGSGIGLNGFNQTFRYCTSLTSIPTDLFRYNTSVTTNGFYYTFYSCTSLTSIPTDLFRYNTSVTTNGFNQTFSQCGSLATIPVDLFRYNAAVTTSGFNQTFAYCYDLTVAPANLFRYNTLCTNFSGVFQSCVRLEVLSNIFYEPGEETTRFLGQAVNFTSAFQRTGFSGIQGTAPNLWTCDFGETIDLSLAPTVDWDAGDTITGQTSGASAIVVSRVSSLVYKIKQHLGTFALGETVGVTGVPDKLALQDGTHPTFTGKPTSTTCYGGAGNSLTSLDNYASIPASWI